MMPPFVFIISKKKRFLSRLLPFLVWALVVFAPDALAHLAPLENRELEEICGSSGISIAIKDVQIFHHIDRYRYYATDNGYIEFQDFFMHGFGDVALFNFDFGSVTDSGILHYDVFETCVAPVNDWSGILIDEDDAVVRGMTSLTVPKWDQELAFTIGNLSFYDPGFSSNPVDLGALTMGLIDMPRFYTYTSPRIDGSGFDFQHSFQMTIDKIGYAYNNNCDALEICPTYIGGDFTDGDDDPTTPSSWMPRRNSPMDFGDFQIGDLFGDAAGGVYSNPAMIDAAEGDIYGAEDLTGTDDDFDYGFMRLQLPMEGSIRFVAADFNGTNFGPGAIDGLQVHRLDMKLIP